MLMQTIIEELHDKSDEQKIELLINSQHPHSTKVTAKLEKTVEFKKFGIEQGTRFTISDLKRLVRIMRPYFPDKESHGKLLVNLGKHDMKINQVIKEHNDDRGNIDSQLQQNVVSNIDERFTLEMSIFKGLPKAKFEVNVLMEVRDKGVSIWLESIEALELMNDQWFKLVDDQTTFFESRGFTVITK